MVLPKFMSPFNHNKVEEAAKPDDGNLKKIKNKKKKKLNDQKRDSTSSDEDGRGERRRITHHHHHETAVMDYVIGLRLVTQISNSSKITKSNNVVVKSSLRKSNSEATTTPNTITCFLKTCSLCNKILSPHKDIYMYRGDQGFCSIECRNRQIVMDEMKELEESTNKLRTTSSSSPRNFWNYDNALHHHHPSLETRLILEDIRLNRLNHHHQSNKPIPSSHQNHRAIVS